MYVRFDENDGQRPVDARWTRALYIHETGDTLTAKDDTWVRQALSYLKRMKLAKAGPDVAASTRRAVTAFPIIHAAEEIKAESRLVRWLLEAMTLANEPRHVMAQATALPSAVVEAYENLFYDVRDRLQADVFIMSSIMPPGMVRTGVPTFDVDVTYKLLAYRGGCKTLLAYAGFGELTPAAQTVIDATIHSNMRRSALTASTARPASPGYANEIITEFLQLQAQEQNRAPEAVHAAFKDSVQTIQSAITLSVGGIKRTPLLLGAVEAGASAAIRRLAEVKVSSTNHVRSTAHE